MSIDVVKLYADLAPLTLIVVAAIFGYRAKKLPFYAASMRIALMVLLISALQWKGQSYPWLLLVPLAYVSARAYAFERPTAARKKATQV